MNFDPYHKFKACSALERNVSDLYASGSVPTRLYEDHEKYHFSIVHKLRSAKYHVDALKGYLSSEAARTIAPNEVIYRVNFHFDGFLHVCGSALDIFAREVITYFALPMHGKVYYHTARKRL